jgi:thiaminase
MSLTCQQLLETYHDAWHSATHHAFLEHCQSGTIQPGQFNTWLVQDYLFVTEFTRMVGRLLAAAPVSHFDTILSGLTALKDELIWFRAKAAERNLKLDVRKQEANKRYRKFMSDLAIAPYVIQATAFWAIELVYNQAWQIHSPMVKPYNEFADRWGNQGFTSYVNLLEKQADEALQNTTELVHNQVKPVFRDVAKFESRFWQMAFEGDR